MGGALEAEGQKLLKGGKLKIPATVTTPYVGPLPDPLELKVCCHCSLLFKLKRSCGKQRVLSKTLSLFPNRCSFDRHFTVYSTSNAEGTMEATIQTNNSTNPVMVYSKSYCP
eukprot:2421602-Pyramimonas_sp.AAC.2